MTKLYWNIRHYFWRRAEKRFVKDCFAYLGDSDVLYIHPREGDPALLALTKWPLPGLYETENHSHVEG